MCLLPQRTGGSGQLPGGGLLTEDSGEGRWGGHGGREGEETHQPGVATPLPRPQKCWTGEMGRGQDCRLRWGAWGDVPGTGWQAGGGGHSPLLILVSQEEILHLLPPEVQLVVVVALDCLSLVHSIIQGQQELLEGLHHGGRHAQVDLCYAAQPGVAGGSAGQEVLDVGEEGGGMGGPRQPAALSLCPRRPSPEAPTAATAHWCSCVPNPTLLASATPTHPPGPRKRRSHLAWIGSTGCCTMWTSGWPQG